VEADRTLKSNRKWAVVIGIGIALSPIHNVWFTDITSINGQPTLFIPALATAAWILATLFFITKTLVPDESVTWEQITWRYIRDKWGELDKGDKRVFIPLLVIIGAMGLSGIVASTPTAAVSPLLMGVSVFALYLASRKLGKDIFLPLAIGTAVASVGIIVYGIWRPGVATGGFIFERNFDIATGYISLGAVLFIHKRQWILVGLAVLALLFSGAPEAAGVLALMTVVLLARRDWSRRLVAIATPIVVAILVLLATGWGPKLYSYLGMVLDNDPVAHYVAPDGETRTNVSPVEIRILVIRDALVNIKPLGEGYNLTEFTVFTVHNVPLIIVQQLGWPGILAGLAWLWVCGYCLVKTKWKYAWIVLVMLCLPDHYVWDQLLPLWWAIVGVSTAPDNIKGDLIFSQRCLTNRQSYDTIVGSENHSHNTSPK